MRRLIILAAWLVLIPSFATAQTPPPGTVRRPAGSGTGPVIVPDHFLRAWDPVTVFFTRPVGKAPGTPEDHPGRLVVMTPPHPGAWTWIDARTLQFRPADAWAPLERIAWTIGAHHFVLHTLMPAPVRTVPRDGATGLDPVEEITLTFPQPIDPRALAKMITVELRPLPGAGSGEARWLTRENYTIKVMERSRPGAPVAYVFHLDSPIPYGTKATVHIRLSLDDSSRSSFARIAFSTAPPFRVVAVGAGRNRVPIASGGSRYTKDEALEGDAGRVLKVELSSRPKLAGPLAVRTLLRISPAVTNLTSSVHGRWITVHGDFARDTLYQVRIVPAPLVDVKGRHLQVAAPSELYVIFPRQKAFLELPSGHGVLERYGPQEIPVKGRGQTRADLRIYPLDPLDPRFWPFPSEPVSVDESRRPPGPGETAGPPVGLAGPVPYQLTHYLVTLGSPPVSQMVELPLKANGGTATFGLNLAPLLRKLAAAGAPGHYLVGLRPLDAGAMRQWMRVQVTDLCLTTAEGPAGAHLAVTSLSTAQPVAGAKVSIEGLKNGTVWTSFFSGTTGPDGIVSFEPGASPCTVVRSACQVLRIVVTKGTDVLVIDPTHPPDVFRDGTWSESSGTWLQWLVDGEWPEVEASRWLTHLFTERPVYRPGQTVHIKGYVRTRAEGRLTIPRLVKTFVVVNGPGDLEWRQAVTLTAEGSFSTAFTKKDAPTGAYTVHLEAVDPGTHASLVSRNVTFRVEAYRIPRFEVDLHGPDCTSLDEPFRISLTATYYAGGRVAGRPVSWRVTQFPYTWHAPGREGFVFSSDARFSGHGRFEATPELTREDRTGPDGGAHLEINPAIEPTAQPRTYVVEATVTGADDQTVTSTRKVVALPAFVLGLKAPRYLERGKKLMPQVLVLDADGAPKSGVTVTVRLKSRQWRSYLRASDFTNGKARYVTDIVDTTVETKKVTSGEKPVTLDFGVRDAGVWVVELEARDAVGRAQTVALDLYAGGQQAVTWPRPSTKTIKVVPDRKAYDPGQVAKLLIESPFQHGRVLAVVEAPGRNRYSWLDVNGGKATFELPVKPEWTPSIPVHFILMRGRIPGTHLLPGSTTDLGKPATMAATSWVKVNPVANRVKVGLKYPKRSLPGKSITVKITLARPDGTPLPGEVTLWLVDQAVLALGHEQPLDPLRDFIVQRQSQLAFRDTRGLPFGTIPLTEAPGGGEGRVQYAPKILERATVRRNFKPVPYYNPRIMVGADGTATVTVALPDNLTNFKIRAIAVSGPERFGYATGTIAVRLPLIVQPALPRFVRPGDAFTAAAIGRVVEGKGGPGAVEIHVTGAALQGKAQREVVWVPNQPLRIPFKVTVPTPEYGPGGQALLGKVTFRVGVQRQSDGVMDAFEVKLPIRSDRGAVVHRILKDLKPGVKVALPPVEGDARPGTVQRLVMLSTEPGLVRMAAGLSFLMEYPFGCTEQRLSRAQAFLEARRFDRLLGVRADSSEIKQIVGRVLAWIPGVIQPNGLVAYWPGSKGYVILTAWTVQFMAEAKDAGYPVDAKMMGQLEDSLERALRSDSSDFIDGAAFSERCWALMALARAGRFNAAYAAELARRARYLNLEAVANVLQSMELGGVTEKSTRQELVQRLWNGVIIRLWQGHQIYGGLQAAPARASALILPSEARTLAGIVRALNRADSSDPRFPVLVNGLVRLGRDDGWGTTNANAAAIAALSDVLKAPKPGMPPQRIALAFGAHKGVVELTDKEPLIKRLSHDAGPASVTRIAGNAGGPPVVVRAETRWVPLPPGSEAAAESHGFVVSREALRLDPDPKAPPHRLLLSKPGLTLTLDTGAIVEDHVQVVNPKDRHFVAIVVPLAAGMEPLNPHLATAPPEAAPSGKLTRQPAYTEYLDDRVSFYYTTLPKGTYDFYFRTRANVPGRFIQPAAEAQMMYDGAVRGSGNGAWIVIRPKGAAQK